MTDLLTHVLAAYIVASLLSKRGLLPRKYVPIAMVGALIPDITKVYFLLGDPTTVIAGVALSWYALQTVGAVALSIGAGVLLFPADLRWVAGGALSLGAALHVLFDLGVARAHGLSPPYFYPLTWWQPPTPGLYISSDIWPSMVALATAALVWYGDGWACRTELAGE